MNGARDRDDVERLDWEIAFYEGILRRDTAYGTVLRVLAELYTRRGRYRDGLLLDRRIVALHPDDPVAHYNLACSLALTDDPGGAFAALDDAWTLGYRDLGWLERDPDLRTLRRDPRYGEFLRSRAAGAPSLDLAT